MKLDRSQIPNLITVLRILLVVPIIALLMNRAFDWALVLFAVAGISDGLDGWLAKRYGWSSRLGSVLDPAADKLLLVSCYLVLGALDLLPWWLVVAVLGRDLVIVAGALAYHFWIGPYEMAPSVLSKLNTTLQIVLVLVVVLNQVLGWLPFPVLGALFWTVFATTVASGLGYVLVWGWRAWQAKRGVR